MLEDLGLVRASGAATADFILAIGPWDWEENAERYEAMMREGVARGIPLICANPDLIVRHGGRLVICAGTLAQRYEALGGAVRWHGKPFRSVYETCLGLLGIANRKRVLAIGDSFRTDIAGANGAGIGSLFIAGGVHADDFARGADGMPELAGLVAAATEHDARADFVLPRLAW